MLRTIVKRLFGGIAFGCVAFTIAVFIVSLISGSTAALIGQGSFKELTVTARAMMLVATGFSVSALVYEKREMVLWLQVLIHMVIGTIIFCLTAYFAGWIPAGGVMLYILLAVLFVGVVWAITYFLLKRMAKRINQKIRKN